MSEIISVLKENLKQAIVGKDEQINLVLVALLSGGHVLLEDVPGVGKTLLAKSLALSINGKFQRVQCTPDLLPNDITGTNIWNQSIREFEFLPGPAFANVLLVDEINRATPRTQSALLEVMEEQQVTVDRVTHKVSSPFFVIATQNPIEYQGTFPLPEAQMDRFMLSLSLGYPSEEDELQMLKQQQGNKQKDELKHCISLGEVKELQSLCKQVTIKEDIQKYIVNLVRASRESEDITLGVSPRGAVALQNASCAYAFLQNRNHVIPDDIKALAPHVLSHRLIPAGGKKAKTIVDKLLNSVTVED